MRVLSLPAFCAEVPAFFLVEALHVLADVLSTCWETCAGNEACACEWEECLGCDLAEVDPVRIRAIRELEAAAAAAASKRYAAYGADFESLGYQTPAFFQAMGALRSEAEGEGAAVKRYHRRRNP